ncbi:MAG: Coenzyme A biosynthesis bifunctional protein CoaBC [Candidatus Marinimicrobia bacterium]|nr:Coenzyme A biosynthesis bifunctional protein CoaBC [Candidatus Neomarinimicrobiota bacterium]
MKVLLGITSSIAAYRMPNLISQGRKLDHEFRVITTEKTHQFVAEQALSIMSQHRCYRNQDEWGNTDEVLHIELVKWCDAFLIAPLTANTLAKLANGICDNLLTSAIRALGETPLIIAPAMNTRMWENNFTQQHISTLKGNYNLTVINPITKKLADGDEGMGALAEDDAILKALNRVN